MRYSKQMVIDGETKSRLDRGSLELKEMVEDRHMPACHYLQRVRTDRQTDAQIHLIISINDTICVIVLLQKTK